MPETTQPFTGRVWRQPRSRRARPRVLQQSRRCVVGILTNGTRDSVAPFGSRTAFLRDILLHATPPVVAFAFTPRDIEWSSRTVIGTFARSDGRWERLRLPLPDVVYNRLASRFAERSSAIQSLKYQLLRRRIPVFNWEFFRKNDVFRWLVDDPIAKAHIPPSLTEPSPLGLQNLIRQHRIVYLKPSAGSLGKGIVRVAQTNAGYTARTRHNGANIVRKCTSMGHLWQLLAGGRPKLSGMIAQKAIRLIKIDEQPVDFRVHVLRDGENNWVIGGIGAKKAGKGSITTHIRNGGTLLTPETALWTVFGDQSSRVLEQLRQVSLDLAKAICRHSRHHIGELGFDIGIDDERRIWLFEANAKPGRSIFKHPALREEGRNTSDLLYAHCAYLAQQQQRRRQRS